MNMRMGNVTNSLFLLILFLIGADGSKAPVHSLAIRNESTGPSPEISPIVVHSRLDAIEESTAASRRAHLTTVVMVASTNLLINALRPDDVISWQMRLPRICWELCIITIAKSARYSSSMYLLLSIMTGTTALVDIFVWAPLFASVASFETCTGGWFSGKPYRCVPDYTKGYGRMFTSMQSLFGGLFYLMTAVVAWSEYSAFRQEHTIKSQTAAFDAWIQKNESISQWIHSTTKSSPDATQYN